MGLQDYFQGLVGTLHKFRESDFLCDTVLVTDDRRELKAHSVVLAAASSVFQAAFKAAADRGPGPLQVNLREYSGDVVEIALQFMYTGQLALLPASFAEHDEWMRLVSILERLGLDTKLIAECQPTFCKPTSDVSIQIKDCSVETSAELEEKLPLAESCCFPQVNAVNSSIDAVSVDQSQTAGSVPQTAVDIGARLKSHKSKNAKDRTMKSKSIGGRGGGAKRRPVKTVASECKSEPADNGSTPPAENGTDNSAEPWTSDGKKQKAFVCELCGRSFGKKERLLLHERTHTGERPYACDTCGRRFALIGNLRRHLPMHAAHKPFLCELCGRSFIRKAYLDDHLAVHKTAHPYACGQCEKRFNSAGQLRLHCRWVHEQQPDAPGRSKHPCDVCGKSFSSRSNLKTHARTHTGERPFVCACGKAYSQRVQLLQHARVHSDERPFQCVTCSRSFRFRGSLVVHLRSHTGDRPHVCEQCGKAYANKTTLWLHTMRLHDAKANPPSGASAATAAAAAAAFSSLPDVKLA